MIELLKQILSNRPLLALVIGWTCAQAMKTGIDAFLHKGFQKERLTGAGGMPSSHTATVVALCTATAKGYGLDSPYFAISACLAAVTIYDALNVRREVEKQSAAIKILHEIMEEGKQPDIPELKVLVGHTPFQVAVGALIGILAGLLFG